MCFAAAAGWARKGRSCGGGVGWDGVGECQQYVSAQQRPTPRCCCSSTPLLCTAVVGFVRICGMQGASACSHKLQREVAKSGGGATPRAPGWLERVGAAGIGGDLEIGQSAADRSTAGAGVGVAVELRQGRGSTIHGGGRVARVGGLGWVWRRGGPSECCAHLAGRQVPPRLQPSISQQNRAPLLRPRCSSRRCRTQRRTDKCNSHHTDTRSSTAKQHNTTHTAPHIAIVQTD